MADGMSEQELLLREQAFSLYNTAVSSGIISGDFAGGRAGGTQAIIDFLIDGTATGHSGLDGFLTDRQTLINDAIGEDVDEQDASLPAFWARISDFFRVIFAGVWSSFRRVARFVTQDIKGELARPFEGFDRASIEGALASMVERGFIDEAGVNELINLYGDYKLGTRFAAIAVVVGTMLQTIRAVTTTSGGDFAKRMMRAFTPNAPSVEQLLRLWFLSPGQGDAIRGKLADLGYSEADQTLMMSASHQPLTSEYIRALYFRGEIPEDQVKPLLLKLGIPDFVATHMMSAWNVVPGIQDILYMMGKEAFEPDVVSYYGYGDELPEEALQWARANGLSEYWLGKYWAAHWSTPSIQQGYEMYHRRIIDDRELDDLFKTIEIPPFWREKLTRMSFQTIGRVDIRRMYQMGVLSTTEVFEKYLDLGYSPDDAGNMTIFTMRLYDEETKSLSRAQIDGFYRDGIITEEQARAGYAELGYSEEQVGLLVAAVNNDIQKELTDDWIDHIGGMVGENLMTLETAQVRLQQLGISAAKTELLLAQWERKQQRQIARPSKTDLDKFLVNKIIDADTYAKEMSLLNYQNRYIVWYLSAAKEKVDAKTAGKFDEAIQRLH